MSNVPIREKVKRITAAAKKADSYSESSKSVGMLVLYIFIVITFLIMLAFSVGLFQTGNYVGCGIVLLITSGLGYVFIKIIRA